jgi:glycosyltransferase involved in cell wall biosynthesis
MNLNPSVEIFIPIYNRIDYIDRALKSATSQDYENLVVTVSDNCSNDGTYEYLKSIESNKFTLKRNEKNLGIFGNFNQCIMRSKADYVLFLCSDDWIETSFISNSVHAILKNDATYVSSICIANYHNGEVADIGNIMEFGVYSGEILLKAWFYVSFYYGKNIFSYPSGSLLNGKHLRNEVSFDSLLGDPADIDMFLRLSFKGRAVFTEYLGANIFIHDNQESAKSAIDGSILNSQQLILEKYRPKLAKLNLFDDLDCLSNFPIIKYNISVFIWRKNTPYFPLTKCKYAFILLGCYKRIVNHIKFTIFKGFVIKELNLKFKTK